MLILLSILLLLTLVPIPVLRHPAFGRHMSPARKARIEACTRAGYPQFVINPRDITKLAKQIR